MSTVRPTHDGRTGAGTAGASRHDGASRQDHARTVPGEHDGQGTGELVRQATQQVSELMRAELRLAVAELKDKGRHAGTGAGLFGGAGLVSLYGVGVLLAAAVAALALVLPVWASALIVGAVLLAVAGVLAMLGRRQTAQATPPKPEMAMDGARQTVSEIKERAHR
ncbi:phage holin family protein [Actinomadura rubrisoli]|uniref:Phage holin family protein n=1 Tax=Actinomadura rubrisoli TaxID=2530368 RepID=A0A4R5ADB6_9ACTN|nr:phage holin family protein [Actinomadura rubrisoli]TDD68824.1 phage holin family protein [Actinomadura rubrisoli]